jgi:carbamoylphosphate synthase small subunit
MLDKRWLSSTTKKIHKEETHITKNIFKKEKRVENIDSGMKTKKLKMFIKQRLGRKHENNNKDKSFF